MGTREGTRELEPDEDPVANGEGATAQDGDKSVAHPEKDETVKPKEEKPVQTVKITEYYVKYKNL